MSSFFVALVLIAWQHIFDAYTCENNVSYAIMGVLLLVITFVPITPPSAPTGRCHNNCFQLFSNKQQFVYEFVILHNYTFIYILLKTD